MGYKQVNVYQISMYLRNLSLVGDQSRHKKLNQDKASPVLKSLILFNLSFCSI